MSASQHERLRQVNIRFDDYGEDDPDFKADLIALMVDNIRELQQAAEDACIQMDGKVLNIAVHKVKSTINLMDDPELFMNIESVKEACNNWSDSTLKKVESFRIFADILIRSLEHEAARLREIR